MFKSSSCFLSYNHASLFKAQIQHLHEDTRKRIIDVRKEKIKTQSLESSLKQSVLFFKEERAWARGNQNNKA